MARAVCTGSEDSLDKGFRESAIREGGQPLLRSM